MGKIKEMLMELREQAHLMPCPDCYGEGTIEVDDPKPQSFSRDVGYIDSRTEVCETCAGDGETEVVCEECGDPVTRIMSRGSRTCEECSYG